jgi:hypothetical protein
MIMQCGSCYLHSKLTEHYTGVEEAQEETAKLGPTGFANPQGRNGEHDTDSRT